VFGRTQVPRHSQSTCKRSAVAPRNSATGDVDHAQRPWFLWDANVSDAELRARLGHPDPAIRAQWQGVILREARFGEVFEYLTLADDGIIPS
jgi:hypothetical protein